MKIFYSTAYRVPGGFDTVSKAASIAERIPGLKMAGFDLDLVAPEPITRLHLLAAHSGLHVQDLADGWTDFGQSDRIANSVAASSAGMVRAAEAAWYDGVSGSLSSGLHHASWDAPSGFCTINGLILAAQEFERLGAENILILDLDAHCGGGTWDILDFLDLPYGHVDVSVSAFDYYEPTSDRHRLRMVSKSRHYLRTIKREIARWVAKHGEPDAVVYNAGMDPHEWDGVGGLDGITDAVITKRERFVFDRFSDVPIVWALAGGYASASKWSKMTPSHLVDLHLLTIRASAATCTLGRRKVGSFS